MHSLQPFLPSMTRDIVRVGKHGAKNCVFISLPDLSDVLLGAASHSWIPCWSACICEGGGGVSPYLRYACIYATCGPGASVSDTQAVAQKSHAVVEAPPTSAHLVVGLALQVMEARQQAADLALQTVVADQ